MVAGCNSKSKRKDNGQMWLRFPVVDLSEITLSLATASVASGLATIPEAAKQFRIPANWARDSTVIWCLLSDVPGSMQDAAKRWKISHRFLLHVSKQYGLTYRNRRPDADTVKQAIAAVERDGLSIRDTAKRVGISKSAVARYVQDRRERVVHRAGQIAFRQSNRTQWSCPVHGAINVYPCVACAAISARAAALKGRHN